MQSQLLANATAAKHFIFIPRFSRNVCSFVHSEAWPFTLRCGQATHVGGSRQRSSRSSFCAASWFSGVSRSCPEGASVQLHRVEPAEFASLFPRSQPEMCAALDCQNDSVAQHGPLLGSFGLGFLDFDSVLRFCAGAGSLQCCVCAVPLIGTRASAPDSYQDSPAENVCELCLAQASSVISCVCRGHIEPPELQGWLLDTSGSGLLILQGLAGWLRILHPQCACCLAPLSLVHQCWPSPAALPICGHCVRASHGPGLDRGIALLEPYVSGQPVHKVFALAGVGKRVPTRRAQVRAEFAIPSGFSQSDEPEGVQPAAFSSLASDAEEGRSSSPARIQGFHGFDQAASLGAPSLQNTVQGAGGPVGLAVASVTASSRCDGCGCRQTLVSSADGEVLRLMQDLCHYCPGCLIQWSRRCKAANNQVHCRWHSCISGPKFFVSDDEECWDPQGNELPIVGSVGHVKPSGTQSPANLRRSRRSRRRYNRRLRVAAQVECEDSCSGESDGPANKECGGLRNVFGENHAVATTCLFPSPCQQVRGSAAKQTSPNPKLASFPEFAEKMARVACGYPETSSFPGHFPGRETNPRFGAQNGTLSGSPTSLLSASFLPDERPVGCTWGTVNLNHNPLFRAVDFGLGPGETSAPSTWMHDHHPTISAYLPDVRPAGCTRENIHADFKTQGYNRRVRLGTRERLVSRESLIEPLRIEQGAPTTSAEEVMTGSWSFCQEEGGRWPWGRGGPVVSQGQMPCTNPVGASGKEDFSTEDFPFLVPSPCQQVRDASETAPAYPTPNLVLQQEAAPEEEGELSAFSTTVNLWRAILSGLEAGCESTVVTAISSLQDSGRLREDTFEWTAADLAMNSIQESNPDCRRQAAVSAARDVIGNLGVHTARGPLQVLVFNATTMSSGVGVNMSDRVELPGLASPKCAFCHAPVILIGRLKLSARSLPVCVQCGCASNKKFYTWRYTSAACASASEARKPKATPAPAPDKPSKPISVVVMPDPSLAGTSAKVHHIYFDFDQTISRIHVFKQLVGWEPGVRSPHALSERGQIHRLKMLNEAGPVFVYAGHAVQVAQTSSTTASWTACALGGPERVGQLGSFFASLKASGVRLSIITKGTVGACRYLLEHEGLLQHFEQVFGMLGQFYGESDFDRANPEPSSLEGSSDCELRESKANLIRSLMSRESLAVEEACLVEDDAQEIASVQGICRSIFVAERRGMTESEMNELQSLAGATAAKVVTMPQAVAPPPPPDGFSGVCKAGGKSASLAKGPVQPAPSAGFSDVFKSAPLEAAAKPATAPAATAGAQGTERAQGGLKHVYFDFDLTISKIHLFKQLAGLEPGVDAPHALSERGQIHRLKVLNANVPYIYQSSNGMVVPCAAGAKGSSWTACALGGPERVGQLCSFFASLKASGVWLSIITKGYVGACRYLLEHEGLLQHFEQVFGMLGQFYGESDLDRANLEPSSLEGSSDYELRESKASLIRSLMSRESLAVEEACLVEDDAQEIASVQVFAEASSCPRDVG